MKKIVLFLPLLAAFPSFVRACGSHDEPVQQSVAFFGFGGFFGGVIGALLVVAIILSLMLFDKRRKS